MSAGMRYLYPKGRVEVCIETLEIYGTLSSPRSKTAMTRANHGRRLKVARAAELGDWPYEAHLCITGAASLVLEAGPRLPRVL